MIVGVFVGWHPQVRSVNSRGCVRVSICFHTVSLAGWSPERLEFREIQEFSDGVSGSIVWRDSSSGRLHYFAKVPWRVFPKELSTSVLVSDLRYHSPQTINLRVG